MFSTKKVSKVKLCIVNEINTYFVFSPKLYKVELKQWPVSEENKGGRGQLIRLFIVIPLTLISMNIIIKTNII